MVRRNRVDLFGLAFLDAMTCGLGAVVLLYMIINASVRLRAGRETHEVRAEVDRLEEEVLEGHNNLVELSNSLREVDNQQALTQGLSRWLIEILAKNQLELATDEEENLARRQHINRLKSDLKSLESEARRLATSTPDEDVPGDRIRAFKGDGDRQYLTGLKVGGKRIFLLVDASASMLDETIVNIIRRRNLPDERKIRAEKWQQAVSTVDWLTAQFPRGSHFQLYTFNETARPLLAGSEGRWLDSDRLTLDDAVGKLRQVVPRGGTNLYRGVAAVRSIRPPPDNLLLLVDGLPTQGHTPPRRRTISGKQRLKLFHQAAEQLPGGVPVNVILFPMEGDPKAPSAYWKLALETGGSFLSPAKDWP